MDNKSLQIDPAWNVIYMFIHNINEPEAKQPRLFILHHHSLNDQFNCVEVGSNAGV